jgi:hypothetical protein
MPPPHKHHTYDAMNDGNAYIMSLEHHIKLNDNATCVEPNHGMIEPLVEKVLRGLERVEQVCIVAIR